MRNPFPTMPHLIKVLRILVFSHLHLYPSLPPPPPSLPPSLPPSVLGPHHRPSPPVTVLHALVSLNSPQFSSAYCVSPVPLSTSFVGMDSLGHSSKPSTISPRWPLHMCCLSHSSERLAARTSHLRGAPLCAEALGRSPQHTATLMLLCPSATPSGHPPC